MKKVLVTGDEGFIATHLQNALLTKGGYQIVGFEINDDPRDYIDDYDIIFHLAAIARTVDCTEDPFGQAHKSNVELTKILLDEFKYKKFVYASSCAVYGSHDGVISENTGCNPPSIYGAQKLLSEKYVQYHCQHRRIPAVCLRLFNTYGPGQSQLGSYPNVIASMIRDFRETGKVKITGDGTQFRDFVHVSDVVRAFIMASEYEWYADVFNVATHKAISMYKLGMMIAGDNLKFIPARDFDMYGQRANYSKIHEVMGWEPMITFEDGLKDVLENDG